MSACLFLARSAIRYVDKYCRRHMSRAKQSPNSSSERPSDCEDWTVKFGSFVIAIRQIFGLTSFLLPFPRAHHGAATVLVDEIELKRHDGCGSCSHSNWVRFGS